MLVVAWSFLVRATEGIDDRVHVSAYAMILALLANLILLVSDYLGGRMAFDLGVSVARQSKRKWRKLAEAGGARLPAEEEKGGDS